MPYRSTQTYRYSRFPRYRMRSKISRFSRSSAASRIQRAWRRRKYCGPTRPTRSFVTRVTNACLKKDPVQYRLFGVETTISQQPMILQNISDLKYHIALSNPQWYRTSPKIRPLNLNCTFRLTAQDSPYNQIVIMFVRHRRSTPIVAADIQSGGGALTTEIDKPFLACTPNTDQIPNNAPVNMTGTNTDAFPAALANMMNPKVVEVLWTKVVELSPQERLTDGTGLTGQVFPPMKTFEYNHKFGNDIWKYQYDVTNEENFPYNNKCYQFLAWSDSVNLSSHPEVNLCCRLSFKDID